MLKPCHPTAGLTALCLLFLLTAGVACEQIENPGKVVPGSPTVQETRSTELQRSQLDDVPVPRDLTLVTRANQSFSYVASGLRVGRFLYRGPVPVDQVVSFLRENMPLSAYGWTPTAESVDGPVARLSFQKGADRCALEVSREDGATTLLIMVNYEPAK
jgi:hypothetical protein